MPGIQVEDEPTYSWRGLMVDCSRHFTPIPELQKLIDALALHRMNRLHLHLSEGSGIGRWTERRGGAARMTA